MLTVVLVILRLLAALIAIAVAVLAGLWLMGIGRIGIGIRLNGNIYAEEFGGVSTDVWLIGALIMAEAVVVSLSIFLSRYISRTNKRLP